MDITVVLGKRLRDDGSMSDELINRLECGIKTYFSTESRFICLCGGCVNIIAKVSEAEKMRDYCVDMGLSLDSIMIENKSISTYHNAKYLYGMLKGEKIENIYLVSTRYHFERKVLPKCQNLFKRFFKDSNIINVYGE